jgi:simple sugar transport system substrate-binding protein
MGGMPMEVAPRASKDAGLDIPNAGFDLTKQIAQNILDGKSIATVDQQPFYQGYLCILQLYYNKQYGLAPCSINTGGSMVDQSNVKQVLPLADSVR